ncbi:N-acyl-D-amino-acid deacylase family protein [Brevibacillus massiliensis]|jgi:N-acyl-D-amino-acid deacylase|uniref:N-acyl-D-amino-acid deacylase family protein n=1 Tax=Brevibacillus massiliensis TaxID=1118054 RepID=UPI000314B79B|nr:D-aminoacylase [Brevibacillus massiliensis]
MYEMIIRNGQVYDGTGNPWTRLDIGIKDGKIAAMGWLAGVPAEAEINAEGLAVAPGFIDTHVHSDLLCTKPDVHHIKVLQGVTSELLGQDGISVAPVSNQTKPLWQKQLRGLNGDIGDWPWTSIEEYLQYLEECNLAGNVTYLVPHGAVRTLVMGFAGRTASREEMTAMRELVEEGMRQGAVGVSSGLVYPPNVFSDKEELIEICRGAAAYDGSFVVHIRNESNRMTEALDEVIDVARQSGVRLHISHFKVIGLKNREKFPQALEKIDRARDEGIEITFDQYPYTAASTVFHAILPPWMHDGGTEQMLARLREPAVRERIVNDFATSSEFENWVNSCGWDKIVISSVSTEKNRAVEGKNLLEIAEMRGSGPADAAFDLLIEENGGVTMVVYWGEEADVMYGMKHPVQIVGSDGIFGGKPHPRLYGTFPRVLGRCVREQRVLTLAEAIRHMTGAPAQLLRFKDRGLLREGYRADVVVFDPKTVLDRATYENPRQEPAGIRHVLVNGQWVVKDAAFTGVTAGQVIRRG